jgi:CHASE2 domain-containing sensor protein
MPRGLKSLMLAVLPLLLVVLVGFSSLTAWFDRVIYDFLCTHHQTEQLKRDDVVLIDIDRESLNRISQWPLSRAVHAEVITRLTSAEVSAIAYNVAFVTADEGEASSDHALVLAIKQSGRVVLPLIAENGQELKPLGRESLSGATLGHADLSVDVDGVLRRGYLHAGIAFPRWPSFSLATLHTFAPVKADDFSGLRTPYLHVAFSKRWSRDYELFLPLGLGLFVTDVTRYSLWELLDGRVDQQALRNKAVFVGVSDPKIEKNVPASGDHLFSSTEIHAFIFSALNKGYTLTPSLPVWAIIIGVLMTLSWAMVLMNLPFGVRLLAFALSLFFASVPLLLLQLGYWLSLMPMLAGVASASGMAILGQLLLTSSPHKKALR